MKEEALASKPTFIIRNFISPEGLLSTRKMIRKKAIENTSVKKINRSQKG
jgi:hypothetical protein